jgi:hypothetical protein
VMIGPSRPPRKVPAKKASTLIGPSVKFVPLVAKPRTKSVAETTNEPGPTEDKKPTTGPTYKGIRGLSVGRCLVSHDQIRSGLQKYIRLGNVEMAVRCAVEFDRFFELGIEGEPIRTNMINRLAIIAMEDIGPANPRLLVYAESLRYMWKVHRLTEKSRQYLVTLATRLAESRKSRLTSHARAVFANPDGRVIARSFGIVEPVETPIDKLPAGRYPQERKETPHLYQGNLDIALAGKSDTAIRWAHELGGCELVVPRERSKNGSRAVWESILDASRRSCAAVQKAVSTLHKWFREMPDCREGPAFAACAILILNRELPPDDKTSEESLVAKDKVDVLYATCPPLTLDDFCVDKHTAKGRAEGKDSVDFALVGARINNVAPWAYSETYEKVYLELRVGTLESTLFANPVRCQLVTSDHKTDTYLATLRRPPLGDTTSAAGSPVFVKGPLNVEAANNQVRIDNIKAFLPGMNVVGYRAVRAVPDLLTSALGRRRSFKGRSPQPFLVAPDLLHPDKYESLPVRTHSSKVWPDTLIYDREKDASARGRHARLDSVSASLLIALCFRYAFRIGDLCDRNFLIVDDRVFSLDEDSCLSSYSPPRYGEAKTKLLVDAAAKLWPEVVRQISTWPALLKKHGDAFGSHIEMDVIPRVETLLEAGPEVLYCRRS